MKILKVACHLLIISNLVACSMKTVELRHAKDPELTKVCRHAFFDWHAASDMVDYYNYKCAQSAIKQGYLLNDDSLSLLDVTIPKTPSGKGWNQALALEELSADRITKQKYGYILGMLEMEYRAKVSKAQSELKSGQITEEEFENIKKQAAEAFYGSTAI